MRTVKIPGVKITVSYSYALHRCFGWINGRQRCCRNGHLFWRDASDCAKYNYDEL